MSTTLGPAAIDPADLSLPPTQPIDVTAILNAQLGRERG
jgi:hypothetical protein